MTKSGKNRLKSFIPFIINSGISSDQDIESIRKIWLLNVCCVVGVLFLIPISIRSLYLRSTLLFTIDIGVIAFFTLSYFFLRKTSNFTVASHFLTHSLFVLFIFLVHSGGVDNTGPVWVFIYPMITLFLYDLKKGMVYSLIFTLCILAILFSPFDFLRGTTYPIEFKRRIMYSYFLVLSITIVYEYARRVTFISMIKVSEQLEKEAKHDTLTGLLNRRGINERLDYEHTFAHRNETEYSVILGDIDHFKSINDQYGHDGGDYVLKEISHVLAHIVRGQDLVARWGGEEFLFLLPDTDQKGAYILGEKIRKAVEDLTINYESKKIKITMSFGTASIKPNLPYEEGIITADGYLFKSKAQGRNRVLPNPDEKSG